MNNNGDETTPSKGFIHIDFVAPGSADFNPSLHNINPIQILAAASYLEWLGRRLLEQSAASKQAQQSIIVPKGILKSH